MATFLTGSSGDSGSSNNNNNANLITCNSDLDGSQKIDVNDVIILYALVEGMISYSGHTLPQFFNILVSDGQVPNIDISGLDFPPFLSIDLPPEAICYDYDQSGEVSKFDVEILSAFVAYMKKITKSEIDITDANKFKLFLSTLETQGLFGEHDDTLPIMLPTIPTDDKIYYTDGTWIPKVAEEDGAYDETNSVKGKQVDGSGWFLVADPGIKSYHKWDGNDKPSYWLNTGLTKLLGNTDHIHNDDAYNILNPPVDLLQTRTLPQNLIPTGTPNVFNSKTICIVVGEFAVSWHYNSSIANRGPGGVVYTYEVNDGPSGMNVNREILVDGDFTQGLPVTQINPGRTQLFVSNPLDSSNPKIFVYDLGSTSFGSISTIETPSYTIPHPVSINSGLMRDTSTFTKSTYEDIGCKTLKSVYVYEEGDVIGTNGVDKTHFILYTNNDFFAYWPYHNDGTWDFEKGNLEAPFNKPVAVGIFDENDNWKMDGHIRGVGFCKETRLDGSEIKYMVLRSSDIVFETDQYHQNLPVETWVQNCKIKLKKPVGIGNKFSKSPLFITGSSGGSTNVITGSSGDSQDPITYNIGFGSSMHFTSDGTKLFVSSPMNKIRRTGNIDHYDTGLIDIECGAVFVFEKNSANGEFEFSETIVPYDIDDYIAKDFDSGSTLDLQFGYSIEVVGSKLYVGCPRAFSEQNTRREGVVYVYNITSGNCVYDSKFTHDDAKFDTTSILNGNFNFGTSIASSSDNTEITIAHNIPGRGTFATKFTSVSGEYKMVNADDYVKVTNQIKTGMLAINTGGDIVFGSENIFRLLT
jgi:hypothetical protein